MKEKMVALTVHLPKAYVEFLEKLVKARVYANRCEAIRMAVRDFMFQEYERLDEVLKNADEGGGL